MTPPESRDPSHARIARRVRWVGVAEGVSYLLLLGVAMPLKYLADMPLAVKYVGWAHGLLWVAYGVVAMYATIKLRLPFMRLVALFVASLVPFGPFVANHRIPELGDEGSEPTGN